MRLKWRHDIHSIRERVRNSKIETWRRRDIEDLFHVRRVSAQKILRAVGGVESLARFHVVDRAALIEFADDMIKADDLETAFQVRLETSEAPPKSDHMLVAIPQEFRNVRFRDLPDGVTVEPGRIEVVGRNPIDVLEKLGILARSMENDPDTIVSKLTPPLNPNASTYKLIARSWLEKEREAASTIQPVYWTCSCGHVNSSGYVCEVCPDGAFSPDLGIAKTDSTVPKQ